MKFEQWISFASIGLCTLAGCDRKGADTVAGPGTSAQASATGAASAPKELVLEPLPGGTVSVLKGYKPPSFQIPVGPMLGIFRGQGVGAIRFGATPETVERLMDAKCSDRTEQLCRYAAHAVDFVFTNGTVSEIRVQGDERPFSAETDDTYGVFNGRFPEGVALGMYSQFVIETLGEPQRKEALKPVEKATAGRFNTVERHYYDGMVLEYDKLENGNTVLAGVILTRPQGGSQANDPAPPAPPTATSPAGTPGKPLPSGDKPGKPTPTEHATPGK